MLSCPGYMQKCTASKDFCHRYIIDIEFNAVRIGWIGVLHIRKQYDFELLSFVFQAANTRRRSYVYYAFVRNLTDSWGRHPVGDF